MKKYLKVIFGLLYTATYYPLVFKIRKIRRTKGQKAARFFLAQKTRQWAEKLEKIFRFKINVSGQENMDKCKGAFLVISNHESAFDIPIIQKSCFNPAFVAKKELKKVPVISAWMKELECAFLDRSSPRKALKVFNDSAEVLKRGKSFVLFPEGTRSKGVLPFKKGSFKLAKLANVPILPVTLKGTSSIIPGLEDKKTTLVECIISEPVYPPFPNDIHLVIQRIIENNYNS